MGKSSQAYSPWKRRKPTPHEYAIFATHPITGKRVRLGLAVATTRPDPKKIQADFEEAIAPKPCTAIQKWSESPARGKR